MTKASPASKYVVCRFVALSLQQGVSVGSGSRECDAEEGCAPLIDTNGELEVAATFVSLPVLKRKR